MDTLERGTAYGTSPFLVHRLIQLCVLSQKHGRKHKDGLEELYGHAICQSKTAFVKKHIDRFDYSLASNKFSDMESDEINAHYKGLKMIKMRPISTSSSPAVPSSHSVAQ